MRRLTAVIVATVVGLTLLTGCGDDGDQDSASSTTAEPELQAYDNVNELGHELNDAGIDCELEYEGLEDETREVSICRIEGQRVTLTIWDDEQFVADFLAENPSEDRVAVGENWTVDAATPEVAAEVADALGGVVPVNLPGTSEDTTDD